MRSQQEITLTIARERRGWYILGDDRIGPFADKDLAHELATALAAFFRSLGYSASVQVSAWVSGPRTLAGKAPLEPVVWRRDAEPLSWEPPVQLAAYRSSFADPGGCDQPSVSAEPLDAATTSRPIASR